MIWGLSRTYTETCPALVTEMDTSLADHPLIHV